MRYFIKLSYDGSNFNGWQTQINATTVQESLEKSISTLLKKKIGIIGAGRTDTNVNAISYIAHFDFDNIVDTASLGYKLNAILPRGIVIHDIFPVADELHARFSASGREYTYFLHKTKDPFIENYSYHYPFDLDKEAMNKAAEYLIGTHDFSCFEKVGSDNKSSICTVTDAFWNEYAPTHVSLLGYSGNVRMEDSPSHQDYLYFRISANRFLRNMVRAVVGSLLEVGRGKKDPSWIDTLVHPDCFSGSKIPLRSQAGQSVPGKALFLSNVKY